MIVYYKGSDIDVEFAVFSDSELQKPLQLNLLEFDVDVVFYTNVAQRVIRACSYGEGTLRIKQTSGNTLFVTIPRVETQQLASGMVTVEFGVIHKPTNKREIAKTESIYIEDSVIGKS